MSVITSGKGFLATRTLAQLQHLAVATGLNVSGVKPALMSRLEDEILPHSVTEKRRTRKSAEMRILSLDMGIRNLAYAFLVMRPKSKSEDCVPTLESWSRVVIASRNGNGSETEAPPSSKGSGPASIPPTKEPFDPATYATHAYSLVANLLNRFKPTHILIERQRFRSGGGSAVQEWTLRVGVFEGMIYAVLETLRSLDEKMWSGSVQGVDPGKVARYWLLSEGEGLKGKQGKMAVVRSWLENGGKSKVRIATTDGKGMDTDGVRRMVDFYLGGGSRTKKGGKLRKKAGTEVRKLDDLADCLLQGVAWIDWRKAREVIVEKGWQEAMDELHLDWEKKGR